MKHRDFRIGLEFRSGAKLYRCTDVGTRTVIAIRIDQVEKRTVDTTTGATTRTILPQADAEAEGWFIGPPYPVAEWIFDEDDIEVLEPISHTLAESPGLR